MLAEETEAGYFKRDQLLPYVIRPCQPAKSSIFITNTGKREEHVNDAFTSLADIHGGIPSGRSELQGYTSFSAFTILPTISLAIIPLYRDLLAPVSAVMHSMWLKSR